MIVDERRLSTPAVESSSSASKVLVQLQLSYNASAKILIGNHQYVQLLLDQSFLPSGLYFIKEE